MSKLLKVILMSLAVVNLGLLTGCGGGGGGSTPAAGGGTTPPPGGGATGAQVGATPPSKVSVVTIKP